MPIVFFQDYETSLGVACFEVSFGGTGKNEGYSPKGLVSETYSHRTADGSLNRQHFSSQDFTQMSIVPQIQVPAELGARLQQLFDLEGTPRTLEEFAELVRGHWLKSLRNPRLNAHLRAIYSGSEIFGNVNYQTPHKVKLEDGRQVSVACALDAIIEGLFLPVEIESTCFHCNQHVRIRISKETVTHAEPSSVVVWLGTSKGETCSCETDACPYINFFASPEHVTDWKDKNPNELGMTLTLQESLNLAREGWWEPVRLRVANVQLAADEHVADS